MTSSVLNYLRGVRGADSPPEFRMKFVVYNGNTVVDLISSMLNSAVTL